MSEEKIAEVEEQVCRVGRRGWVGGVPLMKFRDQFTRTGPLPEAMGVGDHVWHIVGICAIPNPAFTLTHSERSRALFPPPLGNWPLPLKRERLYVPHQHRVLG